MFELCSQLIGILHALFISFEGYYRKQEVQPIEVCTKPFHFKEEHSPFLTVKPTDYAFEPVQTTVPQPTYSMTELGEAEFAFLSELMEANVEMAVQPAKPTYTEVTEMDTDVYLSMEDYEVGEVYLSSDDEPMEDYSTYSRVATISSNRIGLQEWTVEVVGEEQGYFHVSDGNGRTWIYIGEQYDIGRGDILRVIVERHDEHSVLLNDVEILQKKSREYELEICDGYDEFDEGEEAC